LGWIYCCKSLKADCAILDWSQFSEDALLEDQNDTCTLAITIIKGVVVHVISEEELQELDVSCISISAVTCGSEHWTVSDLEIITNYMYIVL
jgi:hypothetical protein